jgi:hypothetical protein
MWSPELLERFPLWAPEHVAVVYEYRLDRPIFLLQEDGLSTVLMLGTAID